MVNVANIVKGYARELNTGTAQEQSEALERLTRETWWLWKNLREMPERISHFAPKAMRFRELTSYEVREAREFVAAALPLIATYNPPNEEKTRKIVGTVKAIAMLNELRERQAKLYAELTEALQHEAIKHGVDPNTIKEQTDADVRGESGELREVPTGGNPSDE